MMFIYFLSRKGWLSFRRDKDYLNALRRDYLSEEDDGKNFHRDRLRPLFFNGLNNPLSMDIRPDSLTLLIGTVPFLNGGLFDKSASDERTNVVVPDECIFEMFDKLFDKFNFTVMESTPFDIEVAVDPEMLGKVSRSWSLAATTPAPTTPRGSWFPSCAARPSRASSRAGPRTSLPMPLPSS